MAHEITSSDNVVLTGQGAWHGLGVVVASAPTPLEALKIAGLSWEVEQWALSTTNGDERIAVTTHRANVRSDNHAVLGVVGAGYVPAQNTELAEFAQALGKEGDVVRVESAGSVMGGRKLWFLLRGQSFSALRAKDDEVVPYVLIANAHDGSMSIHGKFTSIRVVCANTLAMALGQKREGSATVHIRHEGNVKAKIEEARRVLGLYEQKREAFIEQVHALSAREMSREDLQRFFLDAYATAVEPIPAKVFTEEQQKQVDRAKGTVMGFAQVYDRTRKATGDNMWTALNAVTEYFQHVEHVRAADDESRGAARVKSTLFGSISDKTDLAAKVAVASL